MRQSILVVDDYGPFAATLRLLLAADYDVEIVGSAADGLERIARRSFDVVLCDLKLPDMDGEAFFAAVRAHDPLLSDRMVFMTGGGLGGSLARFQAAQRGRVLTKPFEVNALRAALKAARGTGA
ncbi:MAG: response regulator [Myxococcales bacterium]